MEEIAAGLEGENLMNAKHMWDKEYWSLAQLLSANSSRLPLNLSKFFMLHAGTEICRIITGMHADTRAHGHLSTDSVFLNWNMEVFLQKPKVLRVQEQFNIKEFHNDILHNLNAKKSRSRLLF